MATPANRLAGIAGRTTGSPPDETPASEPSPPPSPSLAPPDTTPIVAPGTKSVMVDAPPRGLAYRQLILPIYTPAAFYGISKSLIDPVLPVLLAEEYNEDPVVIGAIVSAFGFGVLCSNVPAGLIVGKVGHMRAFALSMVVDIAASLLGFWAPSAGVITISRVASGVAQSLFNVSRQSFLADYVAKDMRGRAMSALGGVARLSSVVGPLVGGFTAHALGPRYAFLAKVVFDAIVLIGVMITAARLALLQARGALAQLDAAMGDSTPIARRRGCCATLRDFWHGFATVGLFSFLLMSLRAARTLLLPMRGHEVGLSPSEIGVMAAVGFAVDSVLFPASGVLSDKCGRKYAGVPSATILALGFALVGLCTDNIALIVVSALMGFGNGLSAGLVMTLGADMSPPTHRAEFLGVYRTLTDSGVMAGPALVGIVAQHATTMTTGLTVGAVGLFAALWLTFACRDTLKHAYVPVGASPAAGSGGDGDGGGGGDGGGTSSPPPSASDAGLQMVRLDMSAAVATPVATSVGATGGLRTAGDMLKSMGIAPNASSPLDSPAAARVAAAASRGRIPSSLDSTKP